MNKLPPFKFFALQNFPFIEEDFDTIKNYELMCKIVEYIKKNIIPVIDEQSEQIDNLLNWFDNLDVQEEIDNKLDEMAESGELADIIAQYLQLAGVLAYDTLDDLVNAENIVSGSICRTLGTESLNDGYGNFYKIRELINTDVVDGVNLVAIANYNNLVAEKIKDSYVDNLENKLNVISVKDTIINSPLLMLKEYINGTSGDHASFQSVAVKYDSDGVPQQIFVLCNYNNEEYTRLYIATCGNRTDGTGWTYTYSDNVPATHGSSLTYKNGFLYIANIGVDILVKYDIANDSYETISLAHLFTDDPQYIIGIAYDEDSNTWLVGGDDNSKMFVVSSDFSKVIRKYTHDFTQTGDYVEQDFDFYNNIEMRCVSFGYNNMILFIDTFTGNILKSVNVQNITAEIESCSYKKGYLTILYKTFNPALDNINMACVGESYVGGYNGTDYLKMTERRPLINNNVIFNSKDFQWRNNFYLENKNNNNSIVRYAGMGTSANPFKSSLAMLSSIIAISNNVLDYRAAINVGDNTNTDDSFIRLVANLGLVQLTINGNDKTIYGELNVENFNGCLLIDTVNVTAGVSRRDTNGQIRLYQNTDVVIQNANTADDVNIQANYMRVSGSLASDGETFAINRNLLLQGSQASFTGDNLVFSHNIVAS